LVDSWYFMGTASRTVFVNAVGLAVLIAFTALVYLRTEEPLILLVGGLIATVSVIGVMMKHT